MAEIFLSYAREDRENAKQLADALGAMGWEVWWDRTLVPGTNFREEIDRQLSAARCVVVLWSDNSLKAQFVLDEADEARERGVLVQALFRPSVCAESRESQVRRMFGVANEFGAALVYDFYRGEPL